MLTSEKGLLQMRTLVSRFVKNEEGAALVEYGMLVGLIAVVCVVAVTAVGTQVARLLNSIATTLTAIA
jgi:pilus assembly protein Flp/PilA